MIIEQFRYRGNHLIQRCSQDFFKESLWESFSIVRSLKYWNSGARRVTVVKMAGKFGLERVKFDSRTMQWTTLLYSNLSANIRVLSCIEISFVYDRVSPNYLSCMYQNKRYTKSSCIEPNALVPINGLSHQNMAYYYRMFLWRFHENLVYKLRIFRGTASGVPFPVL